MSAKKSRERSPYWRRFPKNLRLVLKDSGVSSVDFAEALSVKATTVSEWLSGKKIPGSDKLFEMADFLGVSVDKLIGRAPPGTAELVEAHARLTPILDGLENILPFAQGDQPGLEIKKTATRKKPKKKA